MVAGTALAGTGLLIVATADAALLRLTVELRAGGLAFVDLLKQAVTLVGVALLVALGARLTPFFAVQIVVGLAVVAIVPLLAGRGAFPRPRFDRAEQRRLLTKGLPVAAAIVLGQIYFRLAIVLMSLISSARQTGYFGGALRAMETLVGIPVLVAGVALPLLAAAARDDRARLRYAIEGLSEGAVIAGVLVVIVTVRAAEPVMALIGGPSFRPTGAVLRIQVGSLLFIALYTIWSISLIALGRERDLIIANAIALSASPRPPRCSSRVRRTRRGRRDRRRGRAARLADLLAPAPGGRPDRDPCRVPRAGARRRPRSPALALLIPGLPDLGAAALAGAVFLAVGALIGMVPAEVRAALAPLARRGAG